MAKNRYISIKWLGDKIETYAHTIVYDTIDKAVYQFLYDNTYVSLYSTNAMPAWFEGSSLSSSLWAKEEPISDTEFFKLLITHKKYQAK